MKDPAALGRYLEKTGLGVTAGETKLTFQNFGFCAPTGSFSEGMPLSATGLSQNKFFFRHNVELHGSSKSCS